MLADAERRIALPDDLLFGSDRGRRHPQGWPEGSLGGRQRLNIGTGLMAIAEALCRRLAQREVMLRRPNEDWSAGVTA